MEDILIFISPDYVIYFWLIVAVLFLFAEIGTPGLFFFIAFSIGSLFAAGAAFLGASFFIQCIVALIFSIGSFFVLKYYFSDKSKSNVATNTYALIGQKGIVLKTIEPNKSGQVKVGGEEWPAKTKNNVILQKGTVVMVLNIEGNKLIVE